ncbi:MAG: hypothetical protein CM1200mP22_01780 [Dehalococcoidia bacterium]|nr:MAG: hypothetical protein CM1200mP22_01780 [Dehalococcoidia bacterium]
MGLEADPYLEAVIWCCAGNPPIPKMSQPNQRQCRCPKISESNYTVRQALRTRAFWILAIFSVFGFVVQAGVSLHQVPPLHRARSRHTLLQQSSRAYLLLDRCLAVYSGRSGREGFRCGSYWRLPVASWLWVRLEQVTVGRWRLGFRWAFCWVRASVGYKCS